MKIAMVSSACAFASRRLAAKSSNTKKPPATEVFFVRAIVTLMSGGTTERTACGMTTFAAVCAKVSPTDRAASAWPVGTELTPDRMASA
jgi:hypothetical protein